MLPIPEASELLVKRVKQETKEMVVVNRKGIF